MSEKQHEGYTPKKYNEIYSEDKTAFGGKPEAFVVEASGLIPKDAAVLEFGAGQGRNALVLAQSGLNVKAIEISEVGVDFMNNLAREKGLNNFLAEVGDARNPIEGEYDMIATTFMLHHLTREEAENFIKEIKSHTKQGGVNAISTFTVEGDFSKIDNRHFYPKLGEMMEFYSDWEIVHYSEEESTARATHQDGTHMLNIKAEIIARKPLV